MQSNSTGFVLTRQSRDIKGQTEIVLWVKTATGPCRLSIVGDNPVLFICASQQQQATEIIRAANIAVQWKPLTLKTFQHQNVVGCYSSTIRDNLTISKCLQVEGIKPFEADVRLADRFLMERFIRGGLAFTGDIKPRNGYRDVLFAKAKAADYIPDLTLVSLDIECSEKGVLYSIGFHSQMDSRVIMVGEQPADYQASDELHIEWVTDEKALLLALESWFIQYDPDIKIGRAHV